MRGKCVLIVDDMIDTGGSLSKAVELLLREGAIKVCACITHGVLSGAAYTKIENSKLTTLYVADTLPVPETKEWLEPQYDAEGNFLNMLSKGVLARPAKIKVVSCAPILAKVITAIKEQTSIHERLEY